MKALGLLLGGMLLLVINTAHAADLQKGLHAYQQGNYAVALVELRPLAEQGNAVAQSNLAAMYALGLGVPQDYAQAFAWFRKAATQGFAVAQFNLGLLYENGQGVPQDYVQAAAWYGKAAAQGNPGAQLNLGLLYAKGQGVQQNYAQALAWFSKAAERGNPASRYYLAGMYANGNGVPQDLVAAYALFTFPAGSLNSNPNLSLAIANARSKLMSVMNPTQIDAGKALAREMQRVGVLEALRKHSPARAS